MGNRRTVVRARILKNSIVSRDILETKPIDFIFFYVKAVGLRLITYNSVFRVPHV